MQGIAESAGTMQRERWDGMGRGKRAYGNVEGCRGQVLSFAVSDATRKTTRTGNGRSGGQAVGVQEEAVLSRKMSRGCVVEQGEQARRPSTL